MNDRDDDDHGNGHGNGNGHEKSHGHEAYSDHDRDIHDWYRSHYSHLLPAWPSAIGFLPDWSAS